MVKRTSTRMYMTGVSKGSGPPQQIHMLSIVETPLQARTVTEPSIEQRST